ncbi:ECF transporter S component [Candidatus Bathyarchaeota archaeon]|nr:ECF transporter S component [Candidatus Bathyarchaeota archaeon]
MTASSKRSLKVSLTAMFTALTTVTTISFSIYVPATKGYFNLGEVMVYTTAILLGPFIGAVAGGVGSMLADVILGYYIYAPGTLIIKGIEGFIVGLLVQKFKIKGWSLKAMSIALPAFTSLTLGIIGSTVYTGFTEAYLGSLILARGELTTIIWTALAFLVFIAMAAFSLKVEPSLTMYAISIFIGGGEMVLGYYLYESLVLGYYALAEVPVNIGQMIIGLIVALPLIKTLSRVRVFAELKLPSEETRTRSESSK